MHVQTFPVRYDGMDLHSGCTYCRLARVKGGAPIAALAAGRLAPITGLLSPLEEEAADGD